MSVRGLITRGLGHRGYREVITRGLVPSDLGAAHVMTWAGRTGRTLWFAREWPAVIANRNPLGFDSAAWKGKTNNIISWGVPSWRSNYRVEGRETFNMIELLFPVRKDSAQDVRYTFRDADGVVIDLTLYTAVQLLTKLDGAAYSTFSATFTDKSTGKVAKTPLAFTVVGVWDIQFVCTDAGGNKLYGEPLQFRVVPNINDLALTELPIY